jgi:PilZ domain-containing protein
MNMKPLTDGRPAEVDEIDDRRSVPNRRESPRRKVLRGGRAVWPNGDSTNVIVYNLSDTGARLEIRDPVPNTFDIVIDGDQYPRSCSVVWRRADRIGVKFQGSSQFVRTPVGSTSSISACNVHAEMCRTLAKRVAPSDRDMLLKMADAWEKIARRLRTAGTRLSDI